MTTTANTTLLPTGTWTVDASHTEVGFTARHLMVTKVRGKFTDVEGTVTVAEPFSASHVQASVKLASVDTGSADRDAHLKSADFFDVENNPEMTFVSTEVSEDTLKGDLTIKGVTRPVEFDLEFGGVATDPWGNTKAGFEAETEINRKDWGLEWNVALEGGGVLVSEKIKIKLEVQLLKTA
ncbi:Polyisoprenoid-binding protein YceI [Pedococcus cremeus]|uniref:Polyisoprenoid-binding protein YceI n=1 Tax=Pedococcus cremeus TaxID=587636 RepID=A0A1H9XSU7_9MICO|nr:YceI family protein [Pedococcus cremeus]SES49244.1 Polyisoprenoid-binding protein YceI [Pedococcus cremeus]